MSISRLFVFLAFLVPSLAFAEWPTHATNPSVDPRPDDVAVVVGIESYAFLPSISGAIETTNDWVSYFEDELKIENVLVLRDAQATKEQVLEFVDRGVSLAKPTSRVWWVFVGHGATTIDGEAVLIGVDGQRTFASFGTRGIERSEVVKRLEAGPQSDSIVVLDTCFSGRDQNGSSLIENAQPVIATRPSLTKTTSILTASSGDQVAGPAVGHERPAFSYLLLGALRGWASDESGTVTAEEAVKFAQKKLLAVPDRKQTPELLGGNLPLATGVQKISWRADEPPKEENVYVSENAEEQTGHVMETYAPPPVDTSEKQGGWFTPAKKPPYGYGSVYAGAGLSDMSSEANRLAPTANGSIDGTRAFLYLRAELGLLARFTDELDLRIGGLISFAGVRNPIVLARNHNLSTDEKPYEAESRAALVSLFLNPSIAWQLNRGDRSPIRLVFGPEAGINVYTDDNCAAVELDQASGEYTCTDPNGWFDGEFGVGGRVAIEWSFFSFAVMGNYTPRFDAYSLGATLGLTLSD